MDSEMMVNLSSDTETKPTAAMRQVIAAAEVGDEQKGTDPTVNQLLAQVAELLGKEAALFFPGGTMCNHVAIKVHTQPADAVLADRMAHIIRAESAGAAFGSGVHVEPIDSQRGIFTPAAIDEAMARLNSTPFPYAPTPRLLCVEQTHNFGGGAVWQLDELRAATDRAREYGLATHMDGARLMNAVAATGTPAAQFAGCVDSLWIDFTKGLGAPVGAVLAGSKAFIGQARRYKHVYGGAMRQAGIVAAGCLYALDHHIKRLGDDHANAQRLAAGLSQIPGMRVINPQPESNMVFFNIADLGLDNRAFLKRLRASGVMMGAVGKDIRAVTHLDVDPAGIETAIKTVAGVAAEAAGG